METMRRDPTSDDDDEKLVPEWGARADDQIIWVGLAVFAAIFLFSFGLNWLTGDDGESTVAIAENLDEDDGSADVDADGATAVTVPAAPVTTATTAEATTTTTEASTTTTEAPTTTALAGPDLDALTAALNPQPGDLTGVVVGSAVTLTGFVADGEEEATAVEAAEAVDGVESVTSELVLLEPAVAQVLSDEGVVVATVDGVGTEITVSGTLQSEADRAPTIAAAEAVHGVTAIIDELEVSVADDLNALPTIPFATGSSTILAEGQSIVDEAAALITGAGDVAFEVQGYTDITGDDVINLELSQARAAAVVDALVAAGVDPGQLTAIGFGETEQFGTGTSAEALAANRVVRFVQTG
ncbi:MAG: OmpA family protein [Actinomycetota bacterium]